MLPVIDKAMVKPLLELLPHFLKRLLGNALALLHYSTPNIMNILRMGFLHYCLCRNSAYRTASEGSAEGVAVIAGIPPIELQVKERVEVYNGTARKGSGSYSRNSAYRTASEGAGRSIQRNGEEYRTPYSKVATKVGLREIWALDLATDSQHTKMAAQKTGRS
ncbi:hypothetical protein QE152_g1981 [Popillia japonica]|uniref:Uncharacterized protein n=1 Tax=Popillia japonica TaxID=7064 RepID=A0AAW1N4M3_POPJA